MGIGEKGLPSEILGRNTASELVKNIENENVIDKYAFDQIIPFIALTSEKSEIMSPRITSHAETNMRIVEKILGRPMGFSLLKIP